MAVRHFSEILDFPRTAPANTLAHPPGDRTAQHEEFNMILHRLIEAGIFQMGTASVITAIHHRIEMLESL
mgnify:CR=1 FL=1